MKNLVLSFLLLCILNAFAGEDEIFNFKNINVASLDYDSYQEINSIAKQMAMKSYSKNAIRIEEYIHTQNIGAYAIPYSPSGEWYQGGADRTRRVRIIGYGEKLLGDVTAEEFGKIVNEKYIEVENQLAKYELYNIEHKELNLLAEEFFKNKKKLAQKLFKNLNQSTVTKEIYVQIYYLFSHQDIYSSKSKDLIGKYKIPIYNSIKESFTTSSERFTLFDEFSTFVMDHYAKLNSKFDPVNSNLRILGLRRIFDNKRLGFMEEIHSKMTKFLPKKINNELLELIEIESQSVQRSKIGYCHSRVVPQKALQRL